jgi:2-amino-4-deoxychorismate synthase
MQRIRARPARRRALMAALTEPGQAFALLRRPYGHGRDSVDVMLGRAEIVERLSDIPIPTHAAGVAGHDVLALIPYRQIIERGFECHDDGTPLVAISIAEHHRLPRKDALAMLPDHLPPPLRGGFDIDDAAYAAIVRDVLTHEIAGGQGSNFVIRRAFLADLDDYSIHTALAFYRRLLRMEWGAHWTFLIHTGSRTLVGATPERHLGLRDGVVSMSPISGTYRYPSAGIDLRGVLDFLDDHKEIDELSMVLDEELKMMARICSGGGFVRGPYLRQMARLAHTEYAISGRTDLDVRQILRESLFAPPVVGSPLQNACRVIRRHEPAGRGYYSGVAALIGHDRAGRQTLDSAILIRAADIDAAGHVRVDVGATLVRHSRPEAEVAETTGKAAALLAALGSPVPATVTGGSARLHRSALAVHPRVRRALRRRNVALSTFWLPTPVWSGRRPLRPRVGIGIGLNDLRVTIIDAEDMFTGMLAHQLRALGAVVDLRAYAAPRPVACDVVVIGPGPGDPRNDTDPKIARLRELVGGLLQQRVPVLGLCLGHQILAWHLGFAIAARAQPNQGVQRAIDLFGVRRRVGFYNSFAAFSDTDERLVTGGGTVQVSRDAVSGEIHALRSRALGSFQFHPESVLTTSGPAILGAELRRLGGAMP